MLVWQTDFDDDGNTIYEALCTAYSDGFYWRIVPELLQDNIMWNTLGSDYELLSDADETHFSTLEEAKAWCEKAELEAIENAKKDAIK